MNAATTAEATTPGDADLRAHLHRMWGTVAGGWDEHAAYADARGAAVAERMLELTRPGPGERVLELACGPGGLGLAAAARVRPGGEVVLSDVAPEMTAIAARRAAALGLDDVVARALDLEAIDEPDTSYDVVLCREGLMLVPDPARALREIHRVLRPGGRVAVAVWGPREANPWLGIVFDAVGAQLGAPVPAPGLPGPFSLDDADKLADLADAAGLAVFELSELSVPCAAASFDEWWERTCALAGPLARRLAALPARAEQALRARARAAVAVYRTPEGLEIPGLSLILGATRS